VLATTLLPVLPGEKCLVDCGFRGEGPFFRAPRGSRWNKKRATIEHLFSFAGLKKWAIMREFRSKNFEYHETCIQMLAKLYNHSIELEQ
jgi:hypothetical protein